MASISCTLDESSDITDWIARAYKVSDGSLVGSAEVTSSPFSVTTSTTDPCYVTLTPKMGERWAASAVKTTGDYGYPTDLAATPRLYKVFDNTDGDPNWNSVSVLLHCNGSNGSTTFTDEKGHTVSVAGNAQISTAQSKFGGASALFDGSGDWLYLADSADWAMGSGDFTIEFWVRLSGTSDQTFISNGTYGGYSPFHFDLSTGKPRFLASAGSSWNVSITGTSNLSTGTWYHIAGVRYGTSFKLYVDGTSVGTPGTLSGAVLDSATNLYIGAFGGSANYLNGYLDDIRITKGVARYTANFTPPAAQFLHDSGTTGSTEPTWPASGTVVDGDVTWTLVGDLVQPITHGPLIPG